MDNILKVSIATPEGSVFEGPATAVQLPGFDGSFQVLYNHAALVAALVAGNVKVDRPGQPAMLFTIAGGLAEVNQNQVTVITERATTQSDS
jgi:F-type H+-transporting ATPase subunit epsilon